MIHHLEASYQHIRVRQLEKNDIERLRVWRNDETNSRYIQQRSHITPPMQEQWFERYLADTDHYIFAIDETKTLNRFVGSVSLYDFRGDVAECGRFMVGDPEARGKGIGRLGITLCMYLGFERLGLAAIDAVVHEDNISALTTDTKAGFKIVGRHPHTDGRDKLELIVKKAAFYALHQFLPDVLITCQST